MMIFRHFPIFSKVCRLSFRKMSTIEKSIKDLLNLDVNGGEKVVARGWLASVRNQKRVSFLHLNDGSCRTSLQVVAEPSQVVKELTNGTSVEVTGELKASTHAKQALELHASSISVIGPCDQKEYLFQAKSRPSLPIIRRQPHLSAKGSHHSALLRVRNDATMAIHRFFQENGYTFVHTPIITSNDCEGGGEVFTVQKDKIENLEGYAENMAESEDEDGTDNNRATVTPGTGVSDGHKQTERKKDPRLFFGYPAYLTVSGQLHLEAVTGGFRKAYNFGPTFRSENAQGRHHLCEFYMVEAELAFTQNIDCILKVMEGLVQTVTGRLLDTTADDLHHFHSPGKGSPTPTVNMDLLNNMSHKPFERITYTDAIDILEKKNKQFQFKVKWGCNLQKEHELFLTRHCGSLPVFVTDFPAERKPFYAKANTDGHTVAAVDLLLPEVGELCGGSLREDNFDLLKSKMDATGFTDQFDWYLDLRRFGSVPHGGFGMGLERYLQCLLGIHNIKDTIPFPRWMYNCRL